MIGFITSFNDPWRPFVFNTSQGSISDPIALLASLILPWCSCTILLNFENVPIPLGMFCKTNLFNWSFIPFHASCTLVLSLCILHAFLSPRMPCDCIFFLAMVLHAWVLLSTWIIDVCIHLLEVYTLYLSSTPLFFLHVLWI